MRSTSTNARKLAACVAILAAVFVTSIASTGNCATEKTADEPDEIIALEAGDVAPFAGDLYAIAASLRFAFHVETCDDRAIAGITRATRIREAELTGARETAAVRSDADAKRIALLTERLEAADAWYRSPVLWAIVGGVVVIASGAAMAYVGGELGTR